MATANTADFFGGSSAPIPKAKIYAPGDEPNPKNPGGISNNELKRQRDASLKKQAEADRKRIMDAEKERRRKENEKAKAEASRAMHARTGGVLGDLKVLGPVALKAAATAAAIAATGGAALGAVGITAAAGLTAAATTANTVLKGIDTGQKVVAGLKKGDAAGLASAAASGLEQAGIKTPALPSAVKAGKDTVASLNLPKIKVAVTSAKQAVADAKKVASAGVKAATTIAPKAAAAVGKPPAPKNIFSIPVTPLSAAEAAKQKGAANIAHLNQQTAAKITTPDVNQVAALLKVAASLPTSLKATALAAADRAAGVPAGTMKTLGQAQLSQIASGAKISINSNGTVTVAAPAATTAAASLFRPLGSAASAAVQSFTSGAGATVVLRPTTASTSSPIKPPAAASKPPAMTTTKPPAPSPSVLSAPTAPPPAIKPPPASDAPSAASSGPVIEGYLVTFEGRISPDRRFRAA